MEFNDVNGVVYETLKDDYNVFDVFQQEFLYQIDMKWEQFIQTKDLGLNTTDIPHCYTIVNAKKWAFARIKYGI